MLIGQGTGVDYSGGFQFAGLGLNSGASIYTATMSVYVTSTTGASSWRIYGGAYDTCTNFGADRPSAKTRTTAYVDWAPGPGTGWKVSPQISPIIQEIVNRAGFSASSNLCLIVVDRQAANNQYQTVSSYDYSSANVARLNMRWASAAPPAPTPTSTPTSTPTAAAGQATLALSPAGGSYSAGQTFVADIVIDGGAPGVDGAQVFLSFNPDVLAVVDAAGNPAGSITPGTALGNLIANSVNNSAGTIDYVDSVAPGSAAVSGRFTLASVRFKAKLPSQGTSAVFARAWPRESKVTLAGANVLASAGNGSYQIAGGGLQGSVRLGGRATPPSATQAVALSVRFYAAGTSTLLQDVTAHSDGNGAFTVFPVADGTYDIVVKHEQTLSVKKQNVTFSGGAAAAFGDLPLGDANNDDSIDSLDSALLSAALLTACRQSGFDARADFNADCVVDIGDSSLLQANYLRHGPVDAPAP